MCFTPRCVPYLLLSCALCTTSIAQDIPSLLDSSGFTGGVLVHLGCTEAGRTLALCPGDTWTVQGLHTSPEAVHAARRSIRASRADGRVTVATFDGRRLPYVDNMVNLLVVDAPFSVSPEEMTRVLCPQGVLLTKKRGRWTSTTKPRPGEIDEWTHYLHDPAGTMVGQDQVVGPPRGLQWVAEPKWLRNHEFISSMHAMVSSGGRIFYIMDEGLRNHLFLPPHWTLIARDAFNGSLLWKRDIKDWQTHIWPMKSGPGHMPRRLVAVGDTVYVTLGFDEPVTAIDAATGKTVHTYEGTKGTEFQALDLHTGQVRQQFVAENPAVYFMHQRCYPGRATERYIMTSGTGTEFYELGSRKCDIHHYVRGSCIYGLMPSNGLLYKPPDSCACHYQSKVTDLCALAPGESKVAGKLVDAERLIEGPVLRIGAKMSGARKRFGS